MTIRTIIEKSCYPFNHFIADHEAVETDDTSKCIMNDIIHNVLGCAIGFLCFVFCYKQMKRIA